MEEPKPIKIYDKNGRITKEYHEWMLSQMEEINKRWEAETFVFPDDLDKIKPSNE